MPHTFTPPPVPSDQSTTLGRVREDNREHDRALQLELFKLVTYVNTIGGAGASWTEAEIDFLTPSYDYKFTVVDATVGVASKITVIPCGKAATGRTADDWQWDGITFAALPAVGSFTLYAVAHPGPVIGKRKIQYSVAT